jgi:hypothetical protein
VFEIKQKAGVPESAMAYIKHYGQYYPSKADSLHMLDQQSKWNKFKHGYVAEFK